MGDEHTRDEASADLLQAVSKLPIVLAIVDRDGRVCAAGGGGWSLIGVQEGEAIGTDLLTLLDREPGLRQAFDHAFDGERVRYRAPLSQNREILGVLVPDHVHAGQVRTVTALGWRDTDRSRAAKQLADALAEKEALLDELRVQVQQRGLLLRELRHRVKNNLQVMSGILQLQRHSAGSDETRQALSQVAGSIHTLGMIHDLLHDKRTGSELEFGMLARSLASTILDATDAVNHLDLTVEASELPVDEEEITPLALAVHELVLNAVTHGFPQRDPGRLQILGRSTEQARVLVVEDDGVGCAPDRPGNGVGTQLVRTFARHLGGDVVWLHPGAGLRCEIRLPPRSTSATYVVPD